MNRVHIYIEGRVQGVGFRAGMQRRAEQLGVTGFVKNIQDGRVEAIIAGDDEAVDKLVQYAREGPQFANVTTVTIEHQEYTAEFSSFTIG